MRQLLHLLLLGVTIILTTARLVTGSPFRYSKTLQDASEVEVEENSVNRGSSRPYVRISDPVRNNFSNRLKIILLTVIYVQFHASTLSIH